MANVKGNVGEATVVGDRKLFTGIVPVQVMKFNPTKAELVADGIDFQNEIVYTTDKQLEGGLVVKATRLDIWVANPNYGVSTKISIFLEDRARTNKDNTKMQWINSFGQCTWGSLTAPPSDPTVLKWFSLKDVRPAFVGEEELIKFLSKWANASPKEELFLDALPALIRTGNVSELRSLLPVFGEKNRVRVLLTVTPQEKDGVTKYYQNVFPRHFERWNITSNTSWDKQFANPLGEPKGVWTLELKEFKAPETHPDADPAQTAMAVNTEDAPW